MKNINLNFVTSLKIKRGLKVAAVICLTCIYQFSFATITGTTPTPPSVSGCSANASTLIQSVADDIADLQAAYSSDCSSSLTIIPINEGLSSMSTNCSWEYFRNYTINEDNGSTCNQVITVTIEHFGNDNTSPTGSFANITGLSGCQSSAPAFDMAGVMAAYSDNCPTNTISVSLTNTTPSGNNGAWSVTYTYTVSDGCGANDLVGETYTVSGSDNTLPTGASTAGSTGTDACLADAAGLFTFDATAAAMGYTDNCGGTVTATNDVESVSGNDCGWTVTYTFDIDDGNGNVLPGQTYTHTGSDQSPPTGASTYVHTATNGCISDAPAFNMTNALMGFSDGTCTGTLTASLDSTTPGSSNSDCSWSLTYNYTVTDGCSNPLSGQSYTVSGGDMTDPIATTISPSSPLTYNIDPTACTITVPATAIDNGSSDNCGSVTIGISSTGTLGTGTTSITLTDGMDFDLSTACPGSDNVYLHVTDACGRETVSSAVAISITASSSTLSFPAYADVTEPIVGSDCNQNVAIQFPVVTTACGISSTPTISTPGTVPPVNFINDAVQWFGDFPLGTTVVQISVMDGCGNVVTDSHNVTVTDGILPQVTFCPPITPVNTTSTTCDNIVSYVDATATENCGFDLTNGMVVTFKDGMGNPIPSLTYTASPTSGNNRTATLGKGTNEITATFMDASGNTSTCVRTVTVTDATPPTTTLPAFTGTTYNTSTGGVTCPSSGTSLMQGLQNVTFGSTFTVAGQTNTAPVVGDFMDNCTFDATTATLNATVTTTAGTPAGCSSVVEILWNVMDCGGNPLAAPVEYEYTINDNSAPTSTTTGDIMNTNNPVDACLPSAATAAGHFDKNQILAVYTDNCQTPLVASNITLIPSGGTVIAGNDCSWTVTHTFTVNDGCGNSTSNRKFITMGGDKTAPTLKATATTPVVANKTMLNDCASNALAAAEAASSVSSEKAALAAAYEDTCGPATLTSANVILIDEASDPLGKVTKTDDCQADGGWEVTREYQIEDACNNKTTTITVKHSGYDQTAPTLTGTAYTDATNHNLCKADVMSTAALNFSTTRAEMGYTDNCASTVTATWTNTALTGDDCTGWTLTYTYDIDDACTGNTLANQSYSHSGINQTGPTITNPQPDQTHPANSASCDQDVRIFNPLATDACGGGGVASVMSISALNPSGINTFNFLPTPATGVPQFWEATFPVGTSTVTITATDACGLTSTDVVLITVIDNSAPFFTGPNGGCPNNITPSVPGICDNDISFLIEATDNCNPNTVNVDVVFSGPPIVPSGRTGMSANATITDTYFRGITTVTLTATNPSGLSNSCSFTIEADDSCGSINPQPCNMVNEVITTDITAATMPALFQASVTTKSDDPATAIPNTGGTIVAPGQNVAFYGGVEVLLLPGFDAQLGSTFLADIAPCIP